MTNQISVPAANLPAIISQLPAALVRSGSVYFSDANGGTLFVDDANLDIVRAAMTATALAAAEKRLLLDYASGKQDAVLAQVWTFNVGAAAAPLKLTTMLDQAGRASMKEIAVWGLMNAAVVGATEPYSNVDMTPATITPAQASLLGQLSDAVRSQSFAVLNSLQAAITAASPTVTTTAQIDAAAWPTPSA